MNRRKSLLAASALILGLALSGCLNLKPVADPTRQFVLTPVTLPGESAQPTSPGLGVGLRAPLLPAYLEDKRLAVRKGEQEIEFLQWSIWAERLDRALLRNLGLNLGRILPSDQLQYLDWTREEVRFEIEWMVNRFEPDSQGTVTLDSVWRILEPGGHQVLRADRTRLQQSGPPPAESPEETVAIMSRLLAEFSRLLAEELRQQAGVPTLRSAREGG